MFTLLLLTRPCVSTSLGSSIHLGINVPTSPIPGHPSGTNQQLAADRLRRRLWRVVEEEFEPHSTKLYGPVPQVFCSIRVCGCEASIY